MDKIDKDTFSCSMASFKCPCCGHEVKAHHKFSDGRRLSSTEYLTSNKNH